MAGSNTTGSQTQQQSGPPSFQIPYLEQIFSQAANLYNEGPLKYGPDRVVGFTPAELQAQQGALGYAQGGAQDIANQAAQAQKFALGDVLDPSSNPNLAKYAEGATRPIFKQLTEQALPAIRDTATANDAMGSSRQGIAEGNAIQGATQQALDTTSKIYSDAYGQGLDTFNKGLALAPQTMALGLQPFDITAGVGAQQRAQEQALRDEQVNKFNFQQYEPYMRLAQFLSSVGGNYGGTGTSQVSQPSSIWERIFGSPLF